MSDHAFMQTLLEQAKASHRAGRYEDANRLYNQVLAIDPNHADTYHLMGLMALELGGADVAEKLLRTAISLRPRVADYHNDLGNALRQQGRLDHAADAFRAAIKLKPGLMPPHNNLGLVLNEQGRFDEALKHFKKALHIEGDNPEIHYNIANVYRDMHRDEDAVRHYETVLRRQPAHPEANSNLANIHKSRQTWDRALFHYDAALASRPDDPEINWNKATMQLVLGDFERGWKNHEWRLKLKTTPLSQPAAPPWTGGDLQGKTILLYMEQGFGDNIQFIRYAPMVKARGARVVLVCPPPLRTLIETADGVDMVVSPGDLLPPLDFELPLLSLPYIFGTREETVPASIPYLRVDQTRVEAWKVRLAGLKGLKTGVAWRGNPNHSNDRNRSVAVEIFSRLADVPGIAAVSLQKDARPEELAHFKSGIYDAGPYINDFADTAALIEALDLVICVDTSSAHLAGALGRPVWTLIPFSPDWRWMLGRSDTPWYPAMCLFRQDTAGDWEKVMDDVARALKEKTV
jgi:tetratricopeptide (TPR) repeat protein